MDHIKNYFKGGKPAEEVRQRRNTMRASRRASTMPSTIEEESATEFNEFEALGEKGYIPEMGENDYIPELQGVNSRFSFMTNATADSSPDHIASARHSFRKSMTGAYRKSIAVDNSTDPDDLAAARDNFRKSIAGAYRKSMAIDNDSTPEDIETARNMFRRSIAAGYRKSVALDNDNAPEDIDAARKIMRNSISAGSYRKSVWAEKHDMGINEEAIPEESEDSEKDSQFGMDEDLDEEQDNANILDELKHEIMVNYLFQQQCARLWIADGTGEVEGVMLRRSRGNYLACPPQLADSIFADSCVELNVQVRINIRLRLGTRLIFAT